MVRAVTEEVSRVPATPVESATAFDLARVALTVLLYRRAKRGSVSLIRITKRERDAISAAIPGQRLVCRLGLDAEGTVEVWLQVIADDGMRPGIVTVPDGRRRD